MVVINEICIKCIAASATPTRVWRRVVVNNSAAPFSSPLITRYTISIYLLCPLFTCPINIVIILGHVTSAFAWRAARSRIRFNLANLPRVNPSLLSVRKYPLYRVCFPTVEVYPRRITWEVRLPLNGQHVLSHLQVHFVRAFRELLRKGGTALPLIRRWRTFRFVALLARYSRIYDEHDEFVQRNGIIPYCRHTSSTAPRFSFAAPLLLLIRRLRAIVIV